MSTDRKESAQSGPSGAGTETAAHSERLLDSLGLIVESGKAKTAADLLRYARQGGLREGIEMLQELSDQGIPPGLALDALRAHVRIVAFKRGSGIVAACQGKKVALVLPLPPHVTAVFANLTDLTYVVPDGHHVPPHLEGLPAGEGGVVVGSRAARALAPSQAAFVFEVVRAGDGYRVDAGVADVVDLRLLPAATRLVVHLRSQGRPEDVALDLQGRTLEML